MPIQSQNPATGDIEKTFTAHTDAEVDLAIALSVTAHHELRGWSFDKRAKAMRLAADILEKDADKFAAMMTAEMGKTLTSAKAEAEKCALVCRYYADEAPSHLADEIVKTDAAKSYRKYLPLGPVLAVMPWNYPFWQVFRFAAPALMAGNTGLLKHASNVPQCAIAIEDIFTRAGFPKGAFQSLLISGDKVERILRDDRVRAATLTGSEPAGQSVAAICGDEIKPVVLELGGSDPFMIMPSADIDEAVKIGTKARTQNNGQSCIAAKRFFIHADIYDEVRDKLRAAFEDLTVGDPTEEETNVGPLVSREARDEVQSLVDDALEAGAVRIWGAESLDGEGAYFRPGLIDNIPKAARAYSEEIFGPVALLFKVESLDEAIEIANSSSFGLGSAIFTTDKNDIEKAVAEIESGATFVNSMTSSNPHLPFGGIKRSGFGRELAREGIRAFCNIKTVSIAK